MIKRLTIKTEEDMGCNLQTPDKDTEKGWKWKSPCPFGKADFCGLCLDHCRNVGKFGTRVSRSEE